MIGGYIGSSIGGRVPLVDIRESDATSSGVATVTGVAAPINAGVGSSNGVATVIGVGDEVIILRRQYTSTDILEKPIDYVLASDTCPDEKPKRAPNRSMTRSMMKNIFGE